MAGMESGGAAISPSLPAVRHGPSRPPALTPRDIIRMMLIRMTRYGTRIIALFAAAAAATGGGVAAAGGLPDAETDGAAQRTALVVDAAQARDGRDLVDDRLEAVDAEVRLPRTGAEAATDLRYFDAQGYRLVVAGPRASAGADAAGLAAVRASDLDAGLAAVAR